MPGTSAVSAGYLSFRSRFPEGVYSNQPLVHSSVTARMPYRNLHMLPRAESFAMHFLPVAIVWLSLHPFSLLL